MNTFPSRLQPSDIRTKIIPVADLDLQGDTGQPLQLYKDVDVYISLLSLLNPVGPRAAQAGIEGGLLSSLQPDPGLILGTEGNLWLGAIVGVGALSAIFDSQDAPFIGVMGNVSAGTTLTIKFSADGATFYGTTTIVIAAAGNFVSIFNSPFRYMQLSTSAAVTITATAQAKK